MTEKVSERKQRHRTGRPPYQPTLESREIVEQMKFCGESEATIARALNIDVDTLRKHFPAELASGHAHRRKEVIGLLFKQAKDGNISATKRLEEMGRVAGAAAAIEAREGREPAAVKLGKKEERQQAAERVSGKFAPPEPPKLVVNNNR